MSDDAPRNFRPAFTATWKPELPPGSEWVTTAIDAALGTVTMELIVTPEMLARWARNDRRRLRMARKKRRGW